MLRPVALRARVLLLAVVLPGFLPALLACSTTTKMRRVEESGLLGDYSQLQEGGRDRAQLVYVDSAADFGKYRAIIIDPVRIYAAEGSPLRRLSPEQADALAKYLENSLHEQLSQDYKIVTEPGPETLRLRAAITEAKGSLVVLDTVSTLVPQMLAVSTLKRLLTGTHTAVAKTRGEMELLDSVSGERLAAGVDARAGNKVTLRLDKLSRYARVRDALDYWAVRIRERLAEARAQGAAGPA